MTTAVHENVQANSQPLENVLTAAMQEGAQAGVERAAADANVQAGTFGGRVNAILGSITAGSKQIMQTTIGRITNAITNSILAGESVQQTTDRVQAILDDQERAEGIALTQVNYAESAGYLDQIAQAGFTEWEWLAYEGACPICEEAAGTHDITDTDQPPAHPNCRCTTTLPTFTEE